MRPWLMRAGVATVVLVSPVGALAQTRAAGAKPAAADRTWCISRTPWGDPDLQEIWSTEDLRDIPYDRCITRGVVGSLLPVAYGNGLQIFQTPSAVIISYAEAIKSGLPAKPRLPIWEAPEGVQVPR